MSRDYFIDDDSFKVFLPSVQFIEKGNDDKFNSRQICGIMNTSRKDRQGENVLAKGLNISHFLKHGHFNDNHSQETSAIVGYPEDATYKSDIDLGDGNTTDGYICKGYIVKGTKRADGIWELAKALQNTPKRLGFSIEGKVERRKNKVIEKAIIRNVAITNCPVNTDATWNILEKSFYDEDIAMKSMSATGVGGGAATAQILGTESLESDIKLTKEEREKKKKKDALFRALGVDDLLKSMDHILELRPEYDLEMAARTVALINKNLL